MGWLWWVLIALLLGGLVWWLVNRSKAEETGYAGTGERADDETGSGSFGGPAAGAAGAAGAAVLAREEPTSYDAPARGDAARGDAGDAAVADPAVADSAPGVAPAGAAEAAAPSADLDPAAAGVPAPSASVDPVTPEASGAAPDGAGWAPADAPVDAAPVAEGSSAPTSEIAEAASPTTADQAAAAADVEVPSDAAPAATAPSAEPASAGDSSVPDTSAAEDAGWTPVESSSAPADAAAPAASGAWAQDQSDVSAAGETPIVSEASGAAAADVAPAADTSSASAGGAATADESGWTPGHQVTESLPADRHTAEESDDGGFGAGTAAVAGGAAVAGEAGTPTAAGDAPTGDSAEVSSHQATESFRDDQLVGSPAGSAPGSASLVDEVQSGSTDIEFADASVASQEPEADPSYTPTHLAPAAPAAPAAPDTSVDPAASPEATPAPETGAGEGFGGAAVGGTAEVSEGRYGPGSAEPTPDGSAPGAAYTIKGNVDSMRFHGPESPYYNRTTAEVWFTDADTARRAGFTPWNEI